MSSRIARRHFVSRAIATGVTLVVGPTALELLPGDELRVTLGGRRATLVPLRRQLSTAAAQWGYYAYQFQQQQMWQQWSAMQYQLHMQQMAAQHAWVQAYQAAMAQQMQGFYARGYTMSEPFAMDSIRSLYSYGSTRSGDELLTGYNRSRVPVQVAGKSARLVDVVQEIGDDLDLDDEDKERASGPQSSSQRVSQRVGSSSVAGRGFRTVEGEAWASDREYEDRDTGDEGNLVIFDSVEGREMRLVPVYS